MEIKRIGLDLAKYVFEVHAVDNDENVVLRKTLRREAVAHFFASYAGIWVMAWFEGRRIVAGVKAGQNLTRSDTP